MVQEIYYKNYKIIINFVKRVVFIFKTDGTSFGLTGDGAYTGPLIERLLIDNRIKWDNYLDKRYVKLPQDLMNYIDKVLDKFLKMKALL